MCSRMISFLLLILVVNGSMLRAQNQEDDEDICTMCKKQFKQDLKVPTLD
jgi:hypothetical protein